MDEEKVEKKVTGDGKVTDKEKMGDGKDVKADENKGGEKSAFDRAVKAAVDESLAGLYARFGALEREVGEISAALRERRRGGESDISINGAVTGETGKEAPDMRVDFSKLSYSELCSFLEKHPRTKL